MFMRRPRPCPRTPRLGRLLARRREVALALLALHGADLAPYLGQFRDVGGRGGIFEEEVGYERMLAMWNVRGNAVHLAVGGPLQPPTVDADDGRWGGKYPFIASLYREARRVLAEEGGGFRLAKVLVLTAGAWFCPLFEGRREGRRTKRSDGREKC